MLEMYSGVVRLGMEQEDTAIFDRGDYCGAKFQCCLKFIQMGDCRVQYLYL